MCTFFFQLSHYYFITTNYSFVATSAKEVAKKVKDIKRNFSVDIWGKMLSKDSGFELVHRNIKEGMSQYTYLFHFSGTLPASSATEAFFTHTTRRVSLADLREVSVDKAKSHFPYVTHGYKLKPPP